METQQTHTSQRLPLSNGLFSITGRDKTNNEIIIRTTSILKRKINIDKTYDYVNHQLSTLSGYEDYELIGETYKKLIHVDMPLVLYSMLEEKLRKGLPMQIIEKFETKNGSFFWLVSKYQSKIDKEGNVSSHMVSSIPVSKQTVKLAKNLYDSLKRIEKKTSDIILSKRYLLGFLENYGHTYATFIEEILNNLPLSEFKNELEKSILIKNGYSKNQIKSKLFTQNKTSNKQFHLRKMGA